MQNVTTAPAAKSKTAKESLTIAFQNFNGVFIAKISNLKGKETFAYGENKVSAEINALQNYRLKYSLQNSAS
ncbi:hypothetical protein [Chryseobacterium sp. MP_3.2]|uniref:hypothetical protein n=1 Tax=Chryseobacterium sp. MP_3.2 TaxID=3071712 RepID=UPI002E04B116|nr:hypothetical protein [Chryseobacterium sp. MP_3.2]